MKSLVFVSVSAVAMVAASASLLVIAVKMV
jgi:hypothetical protein